MPVVTLMTFNLFTKMAMNALSGLEQVAVFAGETRNAGRTILRSAWIAAPIIAVIYILMTGSMLAYTPADKVDLTGPIPQLLAAAFGSQTSASGVNWGLLLGRGTILVLAAAVIAQYVVLVAETSRLPMVAGWDRLVPRWFTQLHPRWKTPTRSITVIVVAAVVLGLAATSGAGAQEAFQLISSAGNLLYGVYYILLFAIPLAAGARFALRPGPWLKVAGISGLLVTVLSMVFNLLPIVDVSSTWIFAIKVVLSAIALNLLGVGVYWWGTRKRRQPELNQSSQTP
jgi:amino acid transporter